MVGMGAYQSSTAAGNFVGNPASASHWDAAIVGKELGQGKYALTQEIADVEGNIANHNHAQMKD
jgi:hypothetical protein